MEVLRGRGPAVSLSAFDRRTEDPGAVPGLELRPDESRGIPAPAARGMSAQAVRLARAAEADLPEILELNRLIQPHLRRSLELLRWQYFETPAHDSRIYLAREPHTQALIASYGAVSQWLQVGSARTKGWMIQDVMTHPDHRGKGLLH